MNIILTLHRYLGINRFTVSHQMPIVLYREYGMKRKRFSITIGFCLLMLLSSAEAQPVLDMKPGLQYFDTKNYPKSLEFFKNLSAENPGNGAVFYYLGRSYYQSRQMNKAIGALEKAVTLDDQQADYHYLLGLACASYVSEVGMLKAVSMAKKMKNAWFTACRLDEKHKEARIAIIGFYLTAPGFAGGSVEEAEKHLTLLKQTYPDEVFTEEGQILEKKKQYAEAEKYFKLSVKKNSSPRNLFNLASFLYREKKFDEASQLFDTYLLLDVSWKDPRKTLAHFFLGNIFADKKMFAKAENELLLAKANTNDKPLNEMVDQKLQELN